MENLNHLKNILQKKKALLQTNI